METQGSRRASSTSCVFMFQLATWMMNSNMAIQVQVSEAIQLPQDFTCPLMNVECHTVSRSPGRSLAVECEGCKKFLLPSLFSPWGIIESVQERRRRSRNATHRNFCRTQRGLRDQPYMTSAKFSTPSPLVTVRLKQRISILVCFWADSPPPSADVV